MTHQGQIRTLHRGRRRTRELGAVAFLLLLLALSVSVAVAEEVQPVRAARAAARFLQRSAPNLGATPGDLLPIRDGDERILAWVQQLEPEGFVVLSADTGFKPVICFSEEGRFSFDESKDNFLLHLLISDRKARSRARARSADRRSALVERSRRAAEWAALEAPETMSLASGPGIGLYTNGVWDRLIDTRWFQEGHFNDDCPYEDPDSPGDRRLVGCVATALGQIVNMWKHPASIDFGADDEYRLNGIHFDDDATEYGFPSMAELDSDLATIEYDGDQNEEAALCFGLGVKLRMFYGIGRSGAWVERVSDVLKGDLGFGSAVYDAGRNVWRDRRDDVIRNMKDGWPVQISIIQSEGEGNHSVLIDGYREDAGYEDGWFHLNWGWGGAEGQKGNAWFDLPDAHADYDVIREVVYDICPEQAWSQWAADARNSASVPFPAPADTRPKRKWHKSAPSGYRYKGLVAGAGGRLVAAVSPNDQTGGRHPSIVVFGEDGVIESEHELTNESQGIEYPAQNSRGEVFVATSEGRIYRVDPDTNDVERIFSDSGRSNFEVPLKIDEEDRIYAAGTGGLFCLDRTGRQLWSAPFDPPGNGRIYFTPAIDTQRNRVFVPYYESHNDTAYLAMLDRRTGRSIRTKNFPNIAYGSRSTKSPSVAPSGEVIVSCGTKLYALDPDDSLAVLCEWDSKVSTLEFRALGRNDRVYQSYWKNDGGTWTCNVGALDLDFDRGTETVAWEIPFSLGDYDGISEVYTTSNDVVLFYVRLENGSSADTYRLYAYRDNGDSATQLWTWYFGSAGGLLAFGPDATVFNIEKGGGGKITALTDPDRPGQGWESNARPVVPENEGPADGASGLGETVTLNWSGSDADGHDLTYDVLFGDGELLVNVASVTGTSFQVDGLDPGERYLWTVVADDGQSRTTGETWTFRTADPPTLDTASLPAATAGADYEFQLTNSRGIAPIEWSIQSGFFPFAGDIDADTGTITGVAGGPGNYAFTVRVTDDDGSYDEKQFALTVNPEPEIDGPIVLRATRGRPFSATFTGQRGTPELVWDTVSDNLPQGLVLDADTGQLSGVPTQSGAVLATVRCVDRWGATATHLMAVLVNDPPSLSGPPIVFGGLEREVETGFDVSGGTTPLTWSAPNGLPPGMRMNTTTGELDGVPTTPGRYDLTVRATDRWGAVAQMQTTMEVVFVTSFAGRRSRFFGDGERTVRALDLLEGTRLTVSIRTNRFQAGDASLRLLEDSGAAVDLGSRLRSTRRGVVLRGFQVPRTGRYFLDMDTPSSASISITVKPPSRVVQFGDVAPGETLVANIATLPRAKLRFTVRPARRSPAVPTVLSVQDDDGNEILGNGRLLLPRRSATWVMSQPLPGGDLSVELGAREGSPAGTIAWRVRIREPRGYGFRLP